MRSPKIFTVLLIVKGRHGNLRTSITPARLLIKTLWCYLKTFRLQFLPTCHKVYLRDCSWKRNNQIILLRHIKISKCILETNGLVYVPFYIKRKASKYIVWILKSYFQRSKEQSLTSDGTVPLGAWSAMSQSVWGQNSWQKLQIQIILGMIWKFCSFQI